MSLPKWHPEIVEMIRECAAKSMSSGQTSKHVSEFLGKYLSRNTIVGIAMRAKPVITFGARPPRGGKRKRVTLVVPEQIRLKKETVNNSGMKAINIRRKRAKLIEEAPKMVEAPPEPMVVNEEEVCTILHLTSKNCHWPEWGETSGPYVFCGLPTKKSPYCPIHRRIAGRQYSKREPSASLTAVTVPEKPPKSKDAWSTMNTRFR